jgi:tripartite ATP-independent transporter DctP family solute receptor
MLDSVKQVALVLLVVMFVCGVAFETAAASKIIRAGTTDPLDLPHGKAMIVFKKLVEARSNGAIEVQLFPSNQLGKIVEQIEGVQQGTQEMAMSTPAWFSRFYPQIDVFSLPYVTPDWPSAERMLNSAAAKKVAVEAEKATGIKIAAWFPVGFRHVINKQRAINTIKDLTGLKIRLQDSSVHLATFRALGANPIAVPWTETYQAVQTGVVDGLENSLNVLLSHKFYEVAPHVSTTSHFFAVLLVYMNPKFYDGLTAKEKQIVDNSLEAAQTVCFLLSSDADAAAAKNLKVVGAKVHQVSADTIKAMQAAVKPVYDKFGKKFEPNLSALQAAAAGK